MSPSKAAIQRTRRVFTVFIMLACTSITDPKEVRKLGVIAGYQSGDPHVEIEVNDRLVTVTLTTYGNGCFSSVATEVLLLGLDATVTPYDKDPGCPERNLKHIEHRAVIRFAEPGTARIIVHGIDASTRTAHDLIGGIITIQRTVELR